MNKLQDLINQSCIQGVPFFMLKDIASKITDGMHNLPKEILTKGQYPIISAQNIHDDIIDRSVNKYVEKEIFEKENKRTNAEIDDVLITIVGAIGRTAVINDNPQMLFQRSVCIIKPKKIL